MRARGWATSGSRGGAPRDLRAATAADAPLWQRMGAEIAMALADLIRAGELRRLKVCAAPDCNAVLIDLSRNRSRRFCDTGNCGNRQHVAAYRERRAKAR